MILVPPPCQSVAVIGHESAKAEITAAFDSGRMHHAWLIVGPEGIGKATLAFHVAHMLLSGGANRFGKFNPDHQAARLITAESHPDMFILRRPEDEKTGVLKPLIPVEHARRVDPFLRRTTTYGGHRVVIIDEAHTLNRNGQNAILKVIEEPPPGAVVLLTATTAGALVPTIRSRCRVVSLAPLALKEIEVVFARLGIDISEEVDRVRLLALSEGSVGQAIRILQTEALPLLDELLSIMSDAPNLPVERLHKLADRVGKKAEAESFDVLSGLFVGALRDTIRAAATGEAPPWPALTGFLAPGRLDRALEVWEKTRATFASGPTAYLDPKLVFITAVTDAVRCV